MTAPSRPTWRGWPEYAAVIAKLLPWAEEGEASVERYIGAELDALVAAATAEERAQADRLTKEVDALRAGLWDITEVVRRTFAMADRAEAAPAPEAGS